MSPLRHLLLATLILPLTSQAPIMSDPTDSEAPQPRFLTTQSTSTHPDAGYLHTLERARSRRAASLAEPEGWFSLVALEWLKPGDTTVGSAPDNALHLDRAPAHLATFRVTGSTVRLVAPPGGFPLGTTLNYMPATEAPFSVEEDHPSELRSGGLLLLVIERGDRLYLRVKDAAAPSRLAFHGLRWFFPDLQYRITARWVPSGSAHSLAIPNVLGQVLDESSPGMAEFVLYGQTVRLFPVQEPGVPNALFFIFRDATSKTSTYGAGRFLYTNLPSNGIGRPGTVVLDFNMAENPPCAYTAFATCPLPPQQNRLNIPIPAGEQRYHD